MTTERGVVVCAGRDICRIIEGNGARVSDVKATDAALYVLQGSTLYRYDPLTSRQLAELPPLTP